MDKSPHEAAASEPSQLTLLLNRMRRGDPEAAERATCLVYLSFTASPPGR